MPLTPVLQEFRESVAQCDSLIATAHKVDQTGVPLFSPLAQQQITIAAFLNLFMSWEHFLEQTLTNLMAGDSTLSGTPPVRYASPPTVDRAREMIIGVMRYFDYANHDNLRKMVRLYFDQGYPYEPYLSAIFNNLADLKTMRNASAHITSTTQGPLEGLAMRVLGRPIPGINLYELLTAVDPNSTNNDTIYEVYKKKLLVTAELICQG